MTDGAATVYQVADPPRGESATVAESPSPATPPPTVADPHATRLPDVAAVPGVGNDRPVVPGYEIVRELGRGGMGVVYLARQQRPARLVALKMVLAGPQARAEEVVRFRREVEAIAAAPHPNLVAVYEVGDCDGRPYYAMEFVAGASLARWAAGRPQPPLDAARLAEALARAMHAVHARGIVHRDLKPANVLLAFEGSGEGSRLNDATPKIADFGLAKSLGEADGPTLSGSVLGTPSYMAPEQARGQNGAVGPATDVYALGAVLYELLTGRPPFRAASAMDTVMQVLNDDPVPPRRLQPTVPADLETICLKCLRKVPAHRYGSAGQLADDLGRFVRGEPITARPAGLLERGGKWARRRPAAAALLVVSALALALLTGGALLYHARLGAALRVAEATAEQGRQRLVRLHVARGARLLEAGDRLAALPWFAEALRLSEGHEDEELAHRVRLAVALRQAPRLVQLWDHAAPVRFAVLSADGRRALTAGDDHTARVADTATGAAVGPELRHDRAVTAADLAPDGARAVTVDAGGTVRLWDPASGRVVAVLREKGAAVRGAAFAPAGRVLLTAAGSAVHLWDARSGAALGAALSHDAPVVHAAFSADGTLVLSVAEDQAVRFWDAATRAALGEPVRHGAAVLHAAFAPDGRRAATAGADGTVRLWDVPERPANRPRYLMNWGPIGRTVPVFKHGAAVARVAFSPDGKRLLTAGADQTAGLWDVASGARLARLASRGSIRTAGFSADGRRIVLAGENNLARFWDGATGEPVGAPLRHNGTVLAAAMHPGGRLVLTAACDGLARLWDVGPEAPPPSADPAAAAAPGDGRWPSGDGRRVVAREGDYGARLLEAATGQPLGPPLRHGSAVLYAAFAPDGRRVVTACDDNLARIWDGETGELLAPPLEHASSIVFAVFSPDARWVVTAAADQTARVWDARTGEPITPPLAQPAAVRAAELGADGRLRLSGADGSVRELDLSPDPRPVADLVALAQLLDGRRVDDSRGLLPLTPDELRLAWQQLRPRYPATLAPPALLADGR